VRALVQRVSRASVLADRETVGQIGRGLLLFLGVTHSDTASAAQRLCDKVVGLRIFEDQAGKMNLSVLDIGGEILCVSQFTLYADIRRGRRPSFEAAAPPELAERLYTSFCQAVARAGVPCATGTFGAHMEVSLLNDGPVTILVDSAELDRPRQT
jgi:D-aminoacyl-tRNA deacylase